MISAKESALPYCSEIHLWRIYPADSKDGNCSRFYAAISADERRRAEKFRRSEDQTDFIVRRAALRHILSCYLGIKPGEIEFDYNAFGKPFLAARINHKNLNFSISQTRQAAFCAVTFGQSIGADIEATDGDEKNGEKNLEIAECFFSETEKINIHRTIFDERESAFYRCWTRKEAVLKALGTGLSHPSLDSFTVSTGAESCSTVSFIDLALENQNWRTMTFVFDSKLIASVAFQNKFLSAPRLRFFDWSEPANFYAPTVSRTLDFGNSFTSAGLFSRP